MSWWHRLLGTAPAPEQRARLAALPRPAPADVRLDGRLVVVDVETSGLDPRRDQLLSIGAVAVRGQRIVLAERFEQVLRRPLHSAATVLHGLTPAQLARGTPPGEALLEWLEFLDGSPVVAFHAGFDRAMLDAALRRELGQRFRPATLDLALALPALLPAPAEAQALDAWLARFGVDNAARHHALSDALAAAQLLLVVQKLAGRRGILTVAALNRLIARSRRRAQAPAH